MRNLDTVNKLQGGAPQTKAWPTTRSTRIYGGYSYRLFSFLNQETLLGGTYLAELGSTAKKSSERQKLLLSKCALAQNFVPPEGIPSCKFIPFIYVYLYAHTYIYIYIHMYSQKMISPSSRLSIHRWLPWELCASARHPRRGFGEKRRAAAGRTDRRGKGFPKWIVYGLHMVYIWFIHGLQWFIMVF